MITWKRADPLPDGPEDSRVIDAFYGTNPDGDSIYLIHQVYLDGVRGEYAVLGVLGRMPAKEETILASGQLGPDWENADWQRAPLGICLSANKPN